MRPAWIEISTGALRNNVRYLKSCTGDNVEFMAVIKADAYGHGAEKVAEVLEKEGVERFAVVMVEEGIELRQKGIDHPILVLGATVSEDLEEIIEYNLIPVVFTYSQAHELNRLAKERNKKVDIHIKIDTGMGRLGFMPVPETALEIERISKLSNIRIEGIYSHLSTADQKKNPYVYEQFEKFKHILQELDEKGIHIPIRHLANSAATINFKEMHLDMVRPGTSIYGLYPGPEMKNDPTIKLEPVMSIKARLVHVKKLEKGASLSYGRTFMAERDSVIGVVPMGYVDGVFRKLANRGFVLVRGQRCPIVGTICMDQFMVDLTDLEKVETGDEVVILGSQGSQSIRAEEVGEHAGTISIEIVTRIGKRMPVFYCQ